MTVSRRKFGKGGAIGLLHWAGFSFPVGAAIGSPAGTVRLADENSVATIVTPEQPPGVVQYAAEELAHHVERATEKRPAIVTEGSISVLGTDTLVFLGDTNFARKAGIQANAFAPENATIQTVGNHICICGRDGSGSALDLDTSAGTLFGVYEFLERFLAVRWLWPGDMGTYVPKAISIIVAPTNLVIAPQFQQRHVRSAAKLKSDDYPELGFSKQVATEYFEAQSIFLRRHRMGRPNVAKYGHAFGEWWDKHGTDHPEWFQLVNGKRGPVKAGGRYSMCISDPTLHGEIVSEWRQQNSGRATEHPIFINAVENDIPGLCECAVCRALDGPEAPDYRAVFSPKSRMANLPFVTDRYARSWLAIQQIAAKDNPLATVVGYAYFNYFAPPTTGVKLNTNIVIGYCPSGLYYPRSREELDWLMRQWRGWSDTGAQVFMRANYFLDGYCMPYIFAHQFAEEFQNAAQGNMFGTDFDSLTGHWATQGPNLYMLMRLHTHPNIAADALLDEYYSSFATAANEVKAYFDYWENYTTNGRDGVKSVFEALDATRWRTWAKAAHAVYDEESFKNAEALLEKARAAAAGDAEVLGRIEFLQLGLQHARLCARTAGKLSLGDPRSSAEQGTVELKELLAFRRKHEQSWISNFNHCAWVESKSWVLPPPSSSAWDRAEN
jgi:Domain of unknown function (DUF4838)